MADLPPIAVVLKADTSDLTRGLDHAKQSISGMEGHAKRGGSALGAMKFAAVAAGAAMAGKAIMDFAGGALSAAQESVKADARMDAIAKSMGYVGGAYKGTTDRLKEYADTVSRQIGVDDEQIKAAQGILLTFKNVGDSANTAGGMMDRATKAAFDLSAAGFGSAEGNAKQLGKALQDPVKGLTALGRAGVTFTEQEKARIKTLMEANKVTEAQAIVMAAVEKQAGGTAEATATGVDRMKVAFDGLQEAIGGPLAEVMTGIADAITPVLKDMEGPLGDVAKGIGGTLKSAFEALAPFLPDLAKTAAQLAATMGGVLGSAISALVPVLTPLLDVVSQLVQGLGPRMGQILGKLSELFVKLLGAVMPLLQPLMDLVFTVLDAAMPIIMVVADAVGILIDALSPLLKVAGALLKPLGDLVNVIFKAILPILKPVLPLIQSLAGLLANVLARSIGLTTTAIGYLIVGLAKIAPFVLNNVVTPVVGFFLTMAENIVGAAESAFGWIPGLGDKLGGAKAAIGQFKTDSAAAIKTAAETINTEGSKIGQNLIDSGLATMTDPENINALGNAGYNAGLAAGNGMAAGIAAGAGKKLEEGKLWVQEKNATPAKPVPVPVPTPTPVGGGGGGGGLSDAEQKRLDAMQAKVDQFKTSLDTAHQSIVSINEATRRAFGEPSQILQAFGKESDISGVISQYDALDGALKDYYTALAKMPDISDKTSAKLEKQQRVQRTTLRNMVNGIVEFMRERTRLQDSLTKLDDDYSKQQAKINADYERLDKEAQASIDAINSHWEPLIHTLQQAFDEATDAFNKENKALEDLVQARNGFLSSLASGLSSFVNNLSVDEGAGSFKASLQARLDQVKTFTKNIQTLLAQGLDPALVKQFVSAGVGSAGSVVAELAASGPEDLAAINALQSDLAATSAEFQDVVSKQWFDAGIAAQQAIVGPLETARATAYSALELAKSTYASELKAAEQHAQDMKDARDRMLAQAEKDYETSKAAINAQIDGVNAKITETATAIDAQFAAMGDADKGLPAKMSKVGTDSMAGLLAGMESMRGELKAKAKSLAEAMNKAFRDALQISSPSRVMHLIGKQVGQGLVDGMDSMQGAVVDSSSRLARAAVPVVTPAAIGAGTGAGSQTQNNYHIPVSVTSQADPYEISREIAWNLKVGAA